MERSISQVSRLAGVSSRTLRHYDQIGLLPPARTSVNGYRWYGRAELLRLQRILLLRQLGVSLPRISEIIDGDADETTALRQHRDQLAAERDRLDRIIETVDQTIEAVNGERSLSDEEFFSGLAEGRARLEQDLVTRYGDGVASHFDHAERATAGWSRRDHDDAIAHGRQLMSMMDHARRRGLAPGSVEALDLVAEHYRGVTEMWPADAAAYHALGDLVLDQSEQRTLIEAVDPELPAWLSAAIKAYAEQRLDYYP